MKVLGTVYWLALNAYHEARGESDEGIKAVCKVVLNRAQRRNQTVRQVIYDTHQFSWTVDRRPDDTQNHEAFNKCIGLAGDAVCEFINGDNLDQADHYFASYIDPPRWAAGMEEVTRIGKHIFFKS